MPSGMAPASDIVIHTRLEDGHPVCIRTIRADDAARMRVGIGKMSPQSRYLRFFSGAASPPDWVIDRLTAVDGHDHIAWGALDLAQQDEPAIGAVHAFRETGKPGSAEFSVGVLDDFHGKGLGRLLAATILLHAEREGLAQFMVNILAENHRAREFARSLGARFVRVEDAVMEFRLDVGEGLEKLHAEQDPPGVADVFAAFADHPPGNGSVASRP